MSEAAVNPRAFRIEPVEWEGHDVTFVAIESEKDEMAVDGAVPHNWKRQISEQIDASEHLLVEYFPPEIANNLYRIPFFGRQARRYVRREMAVYSHIENDAARSRRTVNTADIATKLRYLPYETMEMYGYYRKHLEKTYMTEVQPDESAIPSANDARRLFTAQAIRNMLAGQRPTSLLYVAAPAHINRVKRYLTEPEEQHEVNLEGYQRQFRRLDRRIRTYDFDPGAGWVMTAAQDIV